MNDFVYVSLFIVCCFACFLIVFCPAVYVFCGPILTIKIIIASMSVLFLGSFGLKNNKI